jgi:hypothetical protein
MRPVERASETRGSSGLLLLPAVIVGLIVIVLVLVWRSSVSSGPVLPVRAAQDETPARTITEAHPARVSQPTPAEKLAAQPTASAPARASREMTDPRTTLATPTTASAPATTAALPPAATTTGIAVPAAAETPAPLRLQGIMFHPTNPAAMIGGQTLFIGDQLGHWRVIAITKDSATLAGGGQTNILTLPQ